jgi:nucleotide-binding universal stress UspA family protein
MMKRLLLAVDDSKGSVRAAETLIDLFSEAKPVVTLVHVQKVLGQSLVGEGMASGPEMETLREALQGTEHQEALDARANKIMAFYQDKLDKAGISEIKNVVKEGHPAEEILNSAKETQADLIIIGSRGKRTHDFLIGSVSREIANGSGIPVLLTK